VLPKQSEFPDKSSSKGVPTSPAEKLQSRQIPTAFLVIAYQYRSNYTPVSTMRLLEGAKSHVGFLAKAAAA
jgi:hypothetical protein